MDIPSILQQYDALLNKEAFREAGSFLRAALSAAQAEGDDSAALSLYNELMGFERQYGSVSSSVAAAEAALSLLEKLELSYSYPAAMVWLNAATVLKNAGENERAGDCYAEAARCFERFYPAGDKAFAGLYNNMAAWLADAGAFDKAEYYYRRAVGVLERYGDVCDLAVTWMNLALLYNRRDPCDEAVETCVQTGMALLNTAKEPRDGYYYYTCRKCAAAAAELGYLETEQILTERADRCYAGH